MKNKPKKQHKIRMLAFHILELHFLNKSSKDSEIRTSISYNIIYLPDNNKQYKVIFTLELEWNQSQALYCQAETIFEANNPIDNEFKNSSFIQSSSPAIAFPFIRSFITTLTVNAGMPPFILPAYNFTRPQQK